MIHLVNPTLFHGLSQTFGRISCVLNAALKKINVWSVDSSQISSQVVLLEWDEISLQTQTSCPFPPVLSTAR